MNASEKLCPGCGSALRSFAVETVELEGCPHCGGLWFDRDTLRKLAHQAPGQMLDLGGAPRPRGRRLAAPQQECPSCRAALRVCRLRARPQDVAADACPKCGGIWLDHG